jgi:tRNA threonylcarbamoyladenosine biosynthesis protein TsaE
MFPDFPISRFPDFQLPHLRAGITTESAEETRSLAAALAALLPEDCVLALHGTLGVGKTTFVQGLARGLGVPGHVTSPTFTLYNIHHGGRRQLVHLDAYRLDSGAQMESILLEDFLRSPWCLAVEWPEKISDWLPSDAWHLDLSILEADRHHLRLRPPRDS